MPTWLATSLRLVTNHSRNTISTLILYAAGHIHMYVPSSSYRRWRGGSRRRSRCPPQHRLAMRNTALCTAPSALLPPEHGDAGARQGREGSDAPLLFRRLSQPPSQLLVEVMAVSSSGSRTSPPSAPTTASPAAEEDEHTRPHRRDKGATTTMEEWRFLPPPADRAHTPPRALAHASSPSPPCRRRRRHNSKKSMGRRA